jgi:hypothetical protein
MIKALVLLAMTLVAPAAFAAGIDGTAVDFTRNGAGTVPATSTPVGPR